VSSLAGAQKRWINFCQANRFYGSLVAWKRVASVSPLNAQSLRSTASKIAEKNAFFSEKQKEIG
jgi:hypothetical protein